MPEKSTTPMLDAWRQYRDSVYSSPLPASQSQECQQAFMSGALVMFQKISSIASELPEDKAETEVQKLYLEIKCILRLRVVSITQLPREN